MLDGVEALVHESADLVDTAVDSEERSRDGEHATDDSEWRREASVSLLEGFVGAEGASAHDSNSSGSKNFVLQWWEPWCAGIACAAAVLCAIVVVVLRRQAAALHSRHLALHDASSDEPVTCVTLGTPLPTSVSASERSPGYRHTTTAAGHAAVNSVAIASLLTVAILLSTMVTSDAKSCGFVIVCCVLRCTE